jgi:hypothetical protein
MRPFVSRVKWVSHFLFLCVQHGSSVKLNSVFSSAKRSSGVDHSTDSEEKCSSGVHESWQRQGRSFPQRTHSRRVPQQTSSMVSWAAESCSRNCCTRPRSIRRRIAVSCRARKRLCSRSRHSSRVRICSSAARSSTWSASSFLFFRARMTLSSMVPCATRSV